MAMFFLIIIATITVECVWVSFVKDCMSQILWVLHWYRKKVPASRVHKQEMDPTEGKHSNIE